MAEDDEITPISKRMQELRTHPTLGAPTEAQDKTFDEFMQRKPSAQEKKEFEEAFDQAALSDLRQDEQTTACRAPKRTKYLAQVPLRKITSAKKEKAIDEHRPIKDACRRLIGQFGVPTNVTKFITMLHDAGVTTRSDESRYSDSTVRQIVRDYCGVKGVGGRRKKTKKTKIKQ
jgi:rhodanese-related sulfurtransferase